MKMSKVPVLKQELLKHSLLLDIGRVWVATMIANVLLLLFQLIVARGLSPEDYGLFGALFGILYISGALSLAVQISVAGLVASSLSAQKSNTGLLVSSALVQTGLLGLALFIAFSLASPFLSSYLYSPALSLILITGIAIFLLLFLSAIQGALQGTQRFLVYSAMLIVHAGTRLFFGLIALVMKLGVLGVIASISLATLFTIGGGLAMLRPPLTLSRYVLPIRDRSVVKVFVPTLIGAIAINSATSADVVIVRHLFPGMEAGFYTGASLLGRIVLFMPIAVSTVIFPKMAYNWTINKANLGILYKGLGLTAILAGSANLVFILFPAFSLRMLLGEEYIGAEQLVPIYALAMFFFSLTVVFLYYHLAARRMSFLYFVLLPHIVLGPALIYIFHQSLIQVALVVLCVNISLAVWSQVFTKLSPAKFKVQEETAPVGSMANPRHIIE